MNLSEAHASDRGGMRWSSVWHTGFSNCPHWQARLYKNRYFAPYRVAMNSIGTVGTSIRSIAETFRLSTVHDLPNIVSRGKTNLRPMLQEELFPVVLENPLESEMAFADGSHNGLNPTSIPDSATNYYCPEGASCSNVALRRIRTLGECRLLSSAEIPGYLPFSFQYHFKSENTTLPLSASPQAGLESNRKRIGGPEGNEFDG
nr:MAG: hypothetical protein BECKTC1821E_GA0114239_1002100 [Candidatus Kentron sp. TC]VFK53315.1 MAG: hypothetical protein BECKTC1821F_GA0114240_100299 [Candidatus Kentron sp. TC]